MLCTGWTCFDSIIMVTLNSSHDVSIQRDTYMNCYYNKGNSNILRINIKIN